MYQAAKAGILGQLADQYKGKSHWANYWRPFRLPNCFSAFLKTRHDRSDIRNFYSALINDRLRGWLEGVEERWRLDIVYDYAKDELTADVCFNAYQQLA